MALPEATGELKDLAWDVLVDGEGKPKESSDLLVSLSLMNNVEDVLEKNRDKLQSGEYKLRPSFRLVKNNKHPRSTERTKEQKAKRKAHRGKPEVKARMKARNLMKRQFTRYMWYWLGTGDLVWKDEEAEGKFKEIFPKPIFQRMSKQHWNTLLHSE